MANFDGIIYPAIIYLLDGCHGNDISFQGNIVTMATMQMVYILNAK